MLTLLRNAELYAPEARGRRDLLIGGERVLAIGEALPATPLADEVDLAGARVIPGLIDGHVHLGGGGGESGFASRVPPVTLGTLVRAGVTSVVGLLGTDTTTRTIEDLVARTLGLRAEGLSAWCYGGGYQVPPRTLTGTVRGDVVFVDPIIGVGELALSDHRSSQPTLDELLRIASDCHVAGLTTGKAGIVHLHLGDGARGLDLVRRALDTAELPARVFQPTHVNRNPRLLAEAIALATSHGVPIDVTAFDASDDAPDAIVRCLDAPGFPAARLTCSSDGAGCLPVFDGDGRLTSMDVGRPSTLLAALRALVGRGLPLERVVPVFTSNVADQLRLPGKGRLVVGHDADLVILDAAGAIDGVIARGRWMIRGGKQMMFGMFERATS
ncbi:MAG: beta-aspartyl-peptidase [Kofleriaceae bacterium]|nr:beta-aspartyl-peptidase [Myxococcales bacterium]MCB9562516.1 beta-aspartyl-peptidase [Kofleriaceae bacterium]MCB9570723.1 beta-aspartyl-peptidase [Kofleriaceae bacterium]